MTFFKKKKVDILYILSSSDRRAAGLYYATYPLFQQIVKQGYDIFLLSKNTKNNLIDYQDDQNVWLNRILGFSIKNLFILKPKVIHVHGIWGWHAFYALLLSIISGARVIISPHGMMDEWAMNKSKLKKNIAMLIYERFLWGRTSIFHALNNSEKKSILNLQPKKEIEVIPNGITIHSARKEFSSQREKRKMLFIGRLDEKKGILELLDGWKYFLTMRDGKETIELHIAGPGNENYINDIIDTPGIKYHGSVYGEDKDNLYRSVDGFILPSFSEGLPMTVLEAWSWGVPTFITSHCNLHDEVNIGLSYGINPTKESIADAFMLFENLSDNELYDISSKLQSHVRNKYSWSLISKKHVENYDRYIK